MSAMAPGRLAGRVALVTGAAGGIGGAIARRLAAEGAAVALMDLPAAQAALESMAVGLRADGARHRLRLADLERRRAAPLLHPGDTLVVR